MRLVMLLLLASTATAAAQGQHPCADDAVARATPLLKLHLDDAELAKSIAIDGVPRILQAVKALRGDGRFDVLEVQGHVSKADYRMRFIYARIKGTCVLMGQEILDAGNPF
jgi:hypothetical protein